MDADYDPEYSLSADENEGMLRPSLRGNRLDSGPTPGGTIKVNLRDTADYRCITDMITELIDMRARMEEHHISRDRNVKSSLVAPALAQSQVQTSAATTGTAVEGTIAKRKKKKKRAVEGGTSADIDPSRKIEVTIQQNRNAEMGTWSQQPNPMGRRGSASKPPAVNETWSTVVKRGRDGNRRGGNRKPSISVKAPQ